MLVGSSASTSAGCTARARAMPDALALAARQLVGVLAGHLRGRVQADRLQQRVHGSGDLGGAAGTRWCSRSGRSR